MEDLTERRRGLKRKRRSTTPADCATLAASSYGTHFRMYLKGHRYVRSAVSSAMQPNYSLFRGVEITALALALLFVLGRLANKGRKRSLSFVRAPHKLNAYQARALAERNRKMRSWSLQPPSPSPTRCSCCDSLNTAMADWKTKYPLRTRYRLENSAWPYSPPFRCATR